MRETLFHAALAAHCVAMVLLGSGCRLRSTEEVRERQAPSASVTARVVPSAGLLATLPSDGGAPRPTDSAGTALASALAVVAISGLGTSPTATKTPLAAVQASRLALEAGSACLDAAVAGVVVLEDDPELNAGTGAALRLDDTVELDAAVMDSNGTFAAVAGISDVKNPSKVARAVVDTPHHILSGAGATRFARALGFAAFDPRTEAALNRQRELLAVNAQADAGAPRMDTAPWTAGGADGASPRAWRNDLERIRRTGRGRSQAPNPTGSSPEPRETSDARSAPRAASSESVSLPAPSRSATPTTAVPFRGPSGDVGRVSPAPDGGDTVAVLIRCGPGQFAGAVSGGGPWLSLPGRIGDVPVPGGALQVSSRGAVFVSGPGELILTRMLARAISDKLVDTGSARATVDWALAEFPKDQLVVTILDASGVLVAPESASGWAALDPTLRASGEAHGP